MIAHETLTQRTNLTFAPTAIHIEDRLDWREDVKEYIERKSSTVFSKVIQGSTVSDVREELETITGPVVVIVDLRIDNSSYDGYFWILEEWPAFAKEHRQSTIFVISGNLGDQATIQALVRNGVPRHHIFEKSDWADKRDDFIRALDESLDEMEKDVAAAVGNIDAYLKQSFHQVGEAEADDGELRTQILPMLVKTNTLHWEPGTVPDLAVLGQIGNIYACRGSGHTLDYLERDPNVLKVEASRPGAVTDCYESVPFVNTQNVHNDLDERGDRAIVAFVDTGIDVFHQAFRKPDGTTRVLALWNQMDESGSPPAGFSVGTDYTEEQINVFITSQTLPPGLSFSDHDHGSHVASIAAGSRTELFGGGIAPEAGIIVVIPSIETEPRNQNSLGYSVSHVLALKYISDVAASKRLPVVINVSQGQNAGAHDGSSNLEKAFDGITKNGQEPGIVVVKSAGNERNRNIHARLELVSGSQEALKWKRKSTDPTDDMIELWFQAGNEFTFRLLSPQQEASSLITRTNREASGQFHSGNIYKMMFTRRHPDNGDSQLLILISRGSQQCVEIGCWTLEIVGENIKAEGEIHAWLERNSQRPTEFMNHLDEKVTLSIPGTAMHVISVASVASRKPFQLSEFSSYGPTRDDRKKPDLAAPGDAIQGVASNTGNGVITKGGTSMAAPHVAGAIALLLSYVEKRIDKGLETTRLNSEQIQAAVTQGVMGYTGVWTPGLGYGVLDVQGFFREFDFV